MTIPAEHDDIEWNISQLMEQLKDRYHSRELAEEWHNEGQTIQYMLKALADRLSSRYTKPSVLGIGGSGLVFRVCDTHLVNQPFALKFPRPVSVKADLLASMMGTEVSYLLDLHHASIVRIHDTGRVDASDPCGAFPYYIMDYILGEDSSSFFSSYQISESQFIAIVQATADALRYLHAKSIVHMDIKPSNILISDNILPVIADLGTAKKLSHDMNATIVACTISYADPDLIKHLLSDPSSPNRARGSVPRKEITLRWDLHSFGLTLLDWIGFSIHGEEITRQHKLSPYARKYFLLMAARLLGPRTEPWLETRIGLERQFLSEIWYKSADTVLQDIRKLSGDYSIVDLVPELNAYHMKTIQVTAEAPTTYSDRVRAIYNHPTVRRLASIPQLGLISQVYPTANHSRLEHSLGTYHNACKFILSLYYDPISPLFRQIVDASDVCALLATALLHDIGHYPLAHDLEEIDMSLFDHHPLGKALLEKVKQTSGTTNTRSWSEPFHQVLEPWGVTPARIIEILEAGPDKYESPVKDRILNSIIDGPIDADKLDYLRRDASRLNVPYGLAIDFERVLRSLTVILQRKGKQTLACIGVHEKAKVAAEFIVIARYAMYSQVYWHHTVRAMKAMLSRAVLRLLTIKDQKADKLWRTAFRAEFNDLVFSLPRQPYEPILLPLTMFTNEKQQGQSPDSHDIAARQSTIAPADAAVIAFLWSCLHQEAGAEAELLVDLLERKIYSRLFVFSKERSLNEWRFFFNHWDPLSPGQKLDVLRILEQRLNKEMTSLLVQNPPTSAIDPNIAEEACARVAAGKPLILIDVPSPRPGSKFPLFYVIEAQRRQLRKDEKTVGDVERSEAWSNYADGLREQAGKVRIFSHPRFTDLLESVVPRDDFVRLFECSVAEIH